MRNLEIYEDNGGGLHLCILDEAGDCIAIYGNWEYTDEPGILLDAYDQMHDDPDAYLSWDGNELGYIDDEDLTVEDLYNEFEYRDLIAWTDETGELQTIERDRMGAAGRKALDYNSEGIMEIMVRDWLANEGYVNGTDEDDLHYNGITYRRGDEILVLDGDPFYHDDVHAWVQEAHDETTDYIIVDRNKTLTIEYDGTR